MKDINSFEVIIIGGSYAGLSAAMSLGRSLRKVLIIDSGLACNRQTPHSHNFITHDGEKPAEIARQAKHQVLKYSTVIFEDDLAVSGIKTDDGFEITTQTGKNYQCKKLIIATGIIDLIPDIPGFAECWGITVVHCPYCHGYEFKHRKTAILANSDRAMHLAGLVGNLTADLSIITQGKSEFSAEQWDKLRANKITVTEKNIREIIHSDGHIRELVFEDGSGATFDALYAAVPFKQHTEIPTALGCELTEHGYLRVDAFQKTNIKGIYACGDNSSMMRSVATAVYTGNLAGAMVNKELVDETF